MAKDKAGMTPAPRKTTPKKPATAKKVAGKAAPARRKVQTKKQQAATAKLQVLLAELEVQAQGRLGVAVLDTATGLEAGLPVTAAVVHRSYKDKDTGETKIQAQVSDNGFTING